MTTPDWTPFQIQERANHMAGMYRACALQDIWCGVFACSLVAASLVLHSRYGLLSALLALYLLCISSSLDKRVAQALVQGDYDHAERREKPIGWLSFFTKLALGIAFGCVVAAVNQAWEVL